MNAKHFLPVGFILQPILPRNVLHLQSDYHAFILVLQFKYHKIMAKPTKISKIYILIFYLHYFVLILYFIHVIVSHCDEQSIYNYFSKRN